MHLRRQVIEIYDQNAIANWEDHVQVSIPRQQRELQNSLREWEKSESICFANCFSEGLALRIT